MNVSEICEANDNEIGPGYRAVLDAVLADIGINVFINSRRESLPVFWPRFSSAGETTMLDRTDVVG